MGTGWRDVVVRYTGLDPALKARVFERDNRRCRWCGVTNRGLDAHHIEYRRGSSYDVIDNLISLCRLHHDFVHGTPNKQGEIIPKQIAQRVLRELVAHPGTTGSSVWRRLKRQWVLEGRCRHDEEKGLCLDCRRAGGTREH